MVKQSHRSDYNPTQLHQMLDQLFRNLGTPPVSVLATLQDKWEEIVGPSIAAVTRPVSVIDGVLRVACDEPAWATQVAWMEGLITKEFTKIFPETRLESIDAYIARQNPKNGRKAS